MHPACSYILIKDKPGFEIKSIYCEVKDDKINGSLAKTDIWTAHITSYKEWFLMAHQYLQKYLRCQHLTGVRELPYPTEGFLIKAIWPIA